MKYGLALVLFFAIGIMLTSQTITVAEANHNTSNKDEARKQAEKWTEEIKAEKKAKEDAIKAARAAWESAKTAWETAKQNLKTAIQTGDQTQIASAQAAVDAAKIVKDKAWKDYLKSLK